MKKTIWFIFLIGLLSLSGCNKDLNIENKHKEISSTNIISETGVKYMETITGTISQIDIPNEEIILSGGAIFYNNIFSINVDQYMNQWEYTNIYKGVLIFKDNTNKSIQITKYELKGSNICNSEYPDGYSKLSKTTKIVDAKKVYFTNVLFSQSSPGTELSESWQSNICFENNGIIYEISISDDSKFRTDIINSFKFLK